VSQVGNRWTLDETLSVISEEGLALVHKMTVAGVERQSKDRRDNTTVDVATLQANYDRLWLHVRIIYVLLVLLTACSVAATFTFLSVRRQHFFTSAPTAALDSKVSWRNSSSDVEDGVADSGKQTLNVLVGRRRRSSSRRRRLGADDDDDSNTHGDRLSRRLRAARASDDGLPSSSWVNHDDDKDDALWMTMHSKIPVKL